MGNRFRTPTAQQHRARRRIGTLLVGALLTGSLAAIAPVTAHADTVTTPPAVTDPEAIAAAQAQASGTSVPVPADETANSTTVANPDGTLTYTATALPTQVQQNGSWVPVDTALRANSNGTLSPAAVESGVAFSGGGSTPLATLTNATGQQYALSWPSALPTPTVSGATATYSDVLPGVDLQMTATVFGGYTENLIVKTAAAAANPALADIHFNTSTNGLTLGQNAAGGVQATDASGTAVFTSPTPTVWSTPAAAPATGPDAVPRSAVKRAAATIDTDTSTAPVASTDADDSAPDTTLPIQVTSSGLDLLPPASALTGSNVTYPVVIDPATAPANSIGMPSWTWVGSNESVSHYEDTNNTNDNGTPIARAGYDDWCQGGGSGCAAFGVTRTLFSMGSLSQFWDKHIVGATLALTENSPTAGGGNAVMDIHGAGAFDNSTVWSNQPAPWSAIAASATFPSLPGTGQADQTFNLTTLFQNAIASKYNTQTLVLEADNESTSADVDYRKFVVSTSSPTNPSLSISYWSTPNVPTNLHMVNGTQSLPCNPAPGSSTVWINASASKTITLNADISSPDAGYNESSQFWLQNGDPTPTGSWTNLGGSSATSLAGNTGSAAQATTPALVDGDEYQWQVYADNPGGYGSTAAPSASTSCWFRVDMTPPSQPVPGAETAPVGTTSGSLQVSATDSGPNPSGVDHFLYNVNGTSLTSGGDSNGVPVSVPSTGTASIPLPADHWGTNTVWIATVDAAGNQSQPVHYDYYVPQGSYTPGTAGDLNGDGKPDLALVDTAGNLRVYSNPETVDPNPTSTQPAGGNILVPAHDAPNQVGFNNAIVAHNGSFNNDPCDDIIVIQSGNLYVDTNNNCNPSNKSTVFTLGAGQPRPNRVYGDTTNYNPNDWSSVQQAVVLPPTAATNNEPALLTLEDYTATPTLWETIFTNTSAQSSILLAEGSYWNGVTLLSPGNVGGTPALWVRDNSSGSLTQYPNIESWATATTATTQTTGTPTGGTTFATAGYSAQQYPMLTTDGPTDTSSNPDLWAIDSTGRLTYLPTTLNTSTPPVPTVGAPQALTSTGWSDNLQNAGTAPITNNPGPGDVWPLSATTNGTDIGSNPAAATAVTYGPDYAGRTNGATVFNGTSSTMTTTTASLNTTQSFTVSAWAKLNSDSTYDTVASQSDTLGYVNGYYLQYSPVFSGWAFVMPGNDSTTPTTLHAGTGITPALGQWTNLVGTFNAASDTMSLYVNGRLAGTGAGPTTPWSATGPLDIGSAGNTNYFPGSISDLRTYQTALTSDQVAAMYSSDTGNILFPSDSTLYNAGPNSTGTTWSTANATMTFNNGVLTVTNTTDARTWSAGTTGNPGAQFVLQQKDGNFVIYPTVATATAQSGSALWSAATYNNPDDTLILQNDGNLVVYNTAGTAIWSTGTY